MTTEFYQEQDRGIQCCRALRKNGYKVVLINPNPATIMTDPETADVVYIEQILCHQFLYHQSS